MSTRRHKNEAAELEVETIPGPREASHENELINCYYPRTINPACQG
jgi:hypothetical protein